MHINRFVNIDRPHLEPSSVLEPDDVLGEKASSGLKRSLSVDESDGRACASSARLWEDMLEKHRSPFLLLRVADMRMALGSSTTALTLYDELQSFLNDPILGRWISESRTALDKKKESMLTVYRSDSMRAFTPSQRWIPTALDSFPPSSCKVKNEDTQNLLTNWKKLESSGDLSAQFLNMHCLDTNYIEGTFLLNDFDTDILSKSGFGDRKLIPNLSPPKGGAVRDLNLVLDILQDTREALTEIYTFRDPIPRELTMELLCHWHAKLMKSNRVLYNETHPSNKRLVYTNIGVTRQTSCVNVTASSTLSGRTVKIQFCPYDEVNKELEIFCERFNEIIRKDSMDPFAIAAWISHTFTTIHPFEDGNGRLSRILASIPLIRKDLPPLYIMTTFRDAYLLHLNKTRSTPRSEDYQGLMDALHLSTKSGVNILMLDYREEQRRKERESKKQTS